MSSLSISYNHHQSFADRFKKLDTDGDGKISKDEFIAGAPKGTDSTQAGNLYDQLVQASSSSSSATSAASDSSSTGLSASDLQTAFQSLSGSTRQALFQLQANGQYGPPPPPPSDPSTQDSSSTDQTGGTTNPPSIKDLLKHISDDLDQILASTSSSTSSSAGSSTASASTTAAASGSDSSGNTDASSTSSTNVADELSVISRQLEKLLSARKTYGTASANFAPFLGTAAQAAA